MIEILYFSRNQIKLELGIEEGREISVFGLVWHYSYRVHMELDVFNISLRLKEIQWVDIGILCWWPLTERQRIKNADIRLDLA